MGGRRGRRRPRLSARVRKLLAGLVAAANLSTPAGARPACDPEVVIVHPGDAEVVRFAVEVADEPAEWAEGLMHRAELPRDAGMIFVFPEPRPASFWMKNTPLPLDMIFIADDGRVANVAERTTPFSLEPVRSDGPVRAVLEVNAGLAEEFGIGPGTPVSHPAFREARPPWACPD